MKDKGFTLVELLVAISILAILTVIAIPTLRAFQASNDKKTFENYGKSMVTSAKLYNDSYSEDLFGHLENGCQKVTLTEMINKKVAKDITLKDITCNRADKDSFVLVWKYKNEYAFDPVVNCVNSKGTDQYPDNNEALAEACVSATGKPYITVNTVTNQANNTKKKSVVITLNDEFGFTAHQEIQYAFSTVNNDSGTGVTGYKSYKFNNSYIKRASSTVKLSTNSITIPDETTGTYYLYVKPVKVQNIIDESITNIHKFGPYRFDHEPPSCPTIKAYKEDGTEVAKNTAAKISKFSIKYSADDLQNYELKISYDNGSNYSTVTTYGKDKVEYVPTKDGKIIIKTRAKDYANNQSSWCTSNTFIRDTNPPTAPTVTGYKKNSNENITSSSGLSTHATNTWLSGWIFTKASGSKDDNGVNYSYTTTGATGAASNNASYRNINAEGESNIKYRACDDANNCSGWVSYVAKLDRTAPTCGTATGASTTWTKDSRTIKQACTETSGSKCAKASYDKTFSSGTTKTSSDKIKDNAGNERTCNYNVYVDKDAPTCGTATGTSTTWTKDSRTVKQPCSDSGSGCENASYDKTYSSGTTKTASISIKDTVGNTATCTPNVYVDKDPPTPPTINGYKKKDSQSPSSESGLSGYTLGTWYSGYVYAKASGSTDSGSGVEGYYLTTKGQETDVTNSKQSARNVNVEGTATLKWKACDKVGNCSGETTGTVKLDRTEPSVTLTVESAHKDDGYNDKVITYSGTLSDSLSGKDKYCISNKGKCDPTTNAENVSSIPEKGKEKVEVSDKLDGSKYDVAVCLTDKAGNKKCVKKSYTVYLHCSETEKAYKTNTFYYGGHLDHNCSKDGGKGENGHNFPNTSSGDYKDVDYHRPWAMYRLYDYKCYCNFDKYIKDYCSYDSYERASAHSPDNHMTLFYRKNNEGMESCKTFNNNDAEQHNHYRNQNIYIICYHSQMKAPLDADDTSHYNSHGYRFYSYDAGNGVYHDLRKNEWYHSAGDRDEQYVSKYAHGDEGKPDKRDVAGACAWACKFVKNK